MDHGIYCPKCGELVYDMESDSGDDEDTDTHRISFSDKSVVVKCYLKKISARIFLTKE